MFKACMIYVNVEVQEQNGHNFKDYKMVFPHKLVATQGTPWRVEKTAVRGQNAVVSRGGDSEKL